MDFRTDRKWALVLIVSCLVLYGVTVYSKPSPAPPGDAAAVQQQQLQQAAPSEQTLKDRRSSQELTAQIESLQLELKNSKELIALLQKNEKAAEDAAAAVPAVPDCPKCEVCPELPPPPPVPQFEPAETVADANPNRNCGGESSIESLVPANCPPIPKRPTYHKHAFVPRCFQKEVITTTQCVHVVGGECITHRHHHHHHSLRARRGTIAI